MQTEILCSFCGKLQGGGRDSMARRKADWVSCTLACAQEACLPLSRERKGRTLPRGRGRETQRPNITYYYNKIDERSVASLRGKK